MLDRPRHVAAVSKLLRGFPVVAILGARQVGKTTLARTFAASRRRAEFLDLEDAADASRLSEPALALRPARGLVVLDEVQLAPDIFPALRPLADRRPLPARFLLLGSASRELLLASSQSLAGRIAFHYLGGLAIDEVTAGRRRVASESAWRTLWRRGGFPASYLARDEPSSVRWRQSFVATFVERDLARLGVGLPPASVRRFWMMLAHWHGQRWNASEFARAFGMSDVAVRGYLDALTSTLVVRSLQPWHESIAKRQVKSPKVYIADSGILHTLLDVRDDAGLMVHPKVGASFEGFAIEQVIAASDARPEECFHWATQQGAEIDLLIVRGRDRLGVEVKLSEKPEITASIRIAMQDLRLNRVIVVHAGSQRYPLGERVEAVPVSDLFTPPVRRLLGPGRV